VTEEDLVTWGENEKIAYLEKEVASLMQTIEYSMILSRDKMTRLKSLLNVFVTWQCNKVLN
tara:strand:+ start:565 stop:747 length:183 start_codon:yes stop_codon:yes gene_type:complete